MKIYTRTGDDGTTGLFGGARVAKNDDRVEAYGCIDELNSAIGVVRCEKLDELTERVLEALQNELFVLGAEVACVAGKESNLGTHLLTQAAVTRLEGWIDEADRELAPLKVFIVPGGCRASAGLHVARTVARRAERALIGASNQAPVRSELVMYLNRVSDLLFVLARRTNQLAGVSDTEWKGSLRS